MPFPYHGLPHWHSAAPHLALGWPDLCCYGGGCAMIWAGFEMGGGAVLTWVILAASGVPTAPFDFSGLGGTIVALTGLAGVLTGFAVNLRKLKIEEMKIRIEDNQGKITLLEEQLARTRENVHKTANVVDVLNVEREARLLTPDPDKSGPQKVIVMNDPGHPVPTDPVKKEGGGA